MINKQHISKNEAAGKEALEFCIDVVRGDTHQMRERLTAAKTVLEYTKTKPTQKSEVAVSKAEDFLAALAAEAKKGD